MRAPKREHAAEASRQPLFRDRPDELAGAAERPDQPGGERHRAALRSLGLSFGGRYMYQSIAPKGAPTP